MICRWNPKTQKAEWTEKPQPKRRKVERDWRSQSIGCMPDQVNEFNADLRQAGISSSAYYERGTGDLIVEGRDRGVRRDVLKFRDVVDRDGCYGDG